MQVQELLDELLKLCPEYTVEVGVEVEMDSFSGKAWLIIPEAGKQIEVK